jgi:ribosomal-protein-alanine acetyltransferase
MVSVRRAKGAKHMDHPNLDTRADLANPDPSPVIRSARASDIDALLRVETACFETDRLSRRSFTYFLSRARAELFVAEDKGGLLGYGLVLFHRGTALARLYSLAVAPHAQGRGIARLLLEHAEETARAHDTVAIRLEVRADNERAIHLYTRQGYKPFKTLHHYYEDDGDAWRMQKPIRFLPNPAFPNIPYLHQSTDFTCGPASLIMAMAARQQDRAAIDMDPDEELRIWREATTVFMTSGHGGCGPHGLALAAHRRGHPVRTIVSEDGPLFLDTVRDPKKKAVIERVHASFKTDLAAAGLTVELGSVTPDMLEEALRAGWVPLILISTYLFNREKTPHWVVVTGVNDKVILVHDPDMDDDLSKTDVDCVHVPIRRTDFERVARFGKSRLQAAVLVGCKQGSLA